MGHGNHGTLAAGRAVVPSIGTHLCTSVWSHVEWLGWAAVRAGGRLSGHHNSPIGKIWVGVSEGKIWEAAVGLPGGHAEWGVVGLHIGLTRVVRQSGPRV